jgi:hypothetical protein
VKFWSNIWRVIVGRNFDFTILRGACEACSVMRNLGSKSAFDLGLRKTKKNLDRVGRSQGLPDVNWPLASSPVLTTRTRTLVNKIQKFVMMVHYYKHYVF